MKYIKFIKALLIALFVCIALLGITFIIIISIIEPSVENFGGPESFIKPRINKASLSVDRYININGAVPAGEEFIENLNKFSRVHTECFKEDMYYCLFDFESNTLGSRCDNSNWKGKGKNKCYYRYEGIDEDVSFRISAKSWDKDILYVFDSKEGEILHCDVSNPHDCKKVE